jgi:cell wall-associated NlpC family hydrolase
MAAVSDSRMMVVAAARACLGSRFRVQGRAVATGLDCLGLVAIGYAAIGVMLDLPHGYDLRHGQPNQAQCCLVANRFCETTANLAGPGDLLLLVPGRVQIHLAILAGGSFIHADLGLRQIVETPAPELPPGATVWSRFCPPEQKA